MGVLAWSDETFVGMVLDGLGLLLSRAAAALIAVDLSEGAGR